MHTAALLVCALVAAQPGTAPSNGVWIGRSAPAVVFELRPQTPGPSPTNPANPERPWYAILHDIVGDFEHFPSLDTAEWLGAGGAAALAVHPIDDDVNRRLFGRGWVHDVFVPGKVIGYGATQFGLAAATYAWGRAKKEPKVVHLGVDLIRAQALAQAFTYGIKYAVRRDRPDGTGGYSFPSGHATVTFASATVLQRHLGWKAAVPTYAVATYVAASRLHENRHFLSDVVFGSALGIAAGRTVTRHGRNTWTMMPVVGKGVVAVAFVKTPGAAGGR